MHLSPLGPWADVGEYGNFMEAKQQILSSYFASCRLKDDWE